MDTCRTVSGMNSVPPSNGVPEWNLADRLRKIRRDRHLTQEQIATELGIKPVTWAAWESGRNHPDHVLDVAVAIERRYGVPAAWTLGVLYTQDRRTRGSTPEQRFRRRWTDAPGAMAVPA
jgi:transcriptional regulator with XRE-family HTH domain